MAAELTRLTYKKAIQPHLVAESCTICSSSSRRSVRKLLDTPSYRGMMLEANTSLQNTVIINSWLLWAGTTTQASYATWLNCLLTTIGAFVLQSPPDPRTAGQGPMKGFVTSLLVFFLLVSSAYSGGLASILTVPRWVQWTKCWRKERTRRSYSAPL
jgi:hypothetical protein